MQKRYLTGLFVAVLMFAGTPANAITDPAAAPTGAVGDIQSQLQSLMKQIESLKAQIATLQSMIGNGQYKPEMQKMPDKQMTAGPSSAKKRVCSYMLRNLDSGAEGEDVLALQEFLHENGLLGVKPTGYFGYLTSDAVKKWQEKEGIEKAGAFGPLSRERLLAWCSTDSAKMGDATKYDAMHKDPMMEEKKDQITWDEMKKEELKKEEMNKVENKAPSISSVSGPSSLTVGQTGTWVVSATDPENATLRYRMVWNDPSFNQETVKGGDDGFVGTATFTHAYPAAGTYTIFVYVQDQSWNQVKHITSVTVSAGSTE